jgi:hypothetical protein
MSYKKIVMAIGMALLVTGCNTQPLVNVTDQPVVSTVSKQLTADQVRNAIVGAGSGLGWVMTPISPGLVSGRFIKEDHVAVVDIRYTEKIYSIAYKDSTNLKYKKGNIHKAYNEWVATLDRDIQSALLRT